MIDWQPIETAPKDYDRLLLYGYAHGDTNRLIAPQVFIGTWITRFDGKQFWKTESNNEYFWYIEPIYWAPINEPKEAE